MGEGTQQRIAHGEDRLVDVPTAASRLGTSVSHVRAMIRDGRLAHIRVGRFLRVAESELARFLADG